MILNRRELTRFHSDRSSRLVLDALEAAVQGVMPDILVRQALKFDRGLSVHDVHGKLTRLPEFKRAYVVGAGKGAAGMAVALCSILRNRVAGGAITVPYGIDAKIKGVSVMQASHPVPDRSGVEGTKKILEVLGKARQGDLAFVLISGGGSALMPLPAQGMSLADKQEITDQLLRSGASIHEMNAVRKHLSVVKGGQLLRHVDSSCTVVSLIISDVVGDDLSVVASGPTSPDGSTFQDALKILKKYRISGPDAALEHIAQGAKGMLEETPKAGDPLFARAHNILIGGNSAACAAAAGYLKKKGLQAIHLGSEFDGEARDFGAFMARLASDLGGGPFAIIAGGETTVRLGRSSGVGGRNQEAALACMMELPRDVAAAFMGTDGIDGNSDAAGALVSPKTMAIAKKADLRKHLHRHDSYHAFKKLQSRILTGYTGTNVNDISIICRASTGR